MVPEHEGVISENLDFLLPILVSAGVANSKTDGELKHSVTFAGMTVSTFSETPPKNGKLELRSAGLIIAFLAES